MSMNLHITAKLECVAVKTGEKVFKEESFDCWQTPTKVTYEILNSDNMLQAYKDWVLSISEDKEIPVYAKNDIFNEKEPIGTETVNWGKCHLEELDLWVEAMTKDGYEIEFYAL